MKPRKSKWLRDTDKRTSGIETPKLCHFTSADGWLMCQLKYGHEGPCEMKDISI